MHRAIILGLQEEKKTFIDMYDLQTKKLEALYMHEVRCMGQGGQGWQSHCWRATAGEDVLVVAVLGGEHARGDNALGPYELCWSIYQRESVLAGYECACDWLCHAGDEADRAQRLLR